MKRDGPPLESLLRRLSECPSEFAAACQGANGHVALIAIVCDHFRAQSAKDSDPFWSQLRSNRMKSSRPENYFAILSIATWLLGYEWFEEHPETSQPSWRWLTSDSLGAFANLVKAPDCINDPDRREELVRLCLASMDLRPRGESHEQSMDRLTTLDSVERHRILSATVAAERRAREVREAMAKKQALESASRYGE
jgi:hypothetical protein